MSAAEKGVVAAGHPLSAQAGARVLREGGNAVDAAVAAMLTSFVAEALLTGLGAGGYMLVAGGGVQPTLLDFFVEAPAARDAQTARGGEQAELHGVEVSFGDAVQIFHIGPASCGVYGVPAGVCEAMRKWGTVPLEDLTAPAARLARDGVAINSGAGVRRGDPRAICSNSTPECAALWAPDGAILREGETLRNPDLAEALSRLAKRRRAAVLQRRHRHGRV